MGVCTNSRRELRVRAKLMSIFLETSGDFTIVHAMESWKPWKPTTCTSSTETNRGSRI